MIKDVLIKVYVPTCTHTELYITAVLLVNHGASVPTSFAKDCILVMKKSRTDFTYCLVTRKRLVGIA